MAKPVLVEQKEHISQFVRFGIIGGSGVFVNFLSLFFLTKFILEGYAVGFSIFLSMNTNYIFNRIWTFKSKGNIYSEYMKYLLSSLIGAILQYLITILLTEYFRSIGINIIPFLPYDISILYVSSFVGILVGFIVNFLISIKFVFVNS